ncbi:carcinoembryonic antigen-related cell adhesion molecule 4-like [Ambystoma mexicanum]|uniref:carcinoembryonic antigen-related cell adhesion molecule 4-like n=1 Tax=Ambystoma mexicanum TaxID=8296 RepID=UPI0037E993DD
MDIILQGWGPHAWGFILTALLGFGTQECTAQISVKLVPDPPVVGGEITLTVGYGGAINMVNWYRATGNEIFQYNAILTYSPANMSLQTTGSKYTGRETGLPDGSLKIINLKATDMGFYTVQITTPTGPMQNTVHLSFMGRPGAPLTTSAMLGATESGAPPRRNALPIGAIVGGTIGGILAAALLTTAAIMLYKRRRNSELSGRPLPVPPPRRDLQIHSYGASVKSDGYIDPKELNTPTPQYETVLPTMLGDLNSNATEDENVYTELEYSDRNLYNRLQK